MTGLALGASALALLVATTALWFRHARSVSLRGSRVPYVAAWTVAALLGAGALARGPGGVGGVAAGLALTGGVFLLVLVAISRQQVAEGAVRVGATLPSFTALRDDEEPFTLSGLEGRPILLKFFRGHW
jgi:hypothetical protein